MSFLLEQYEGMDLVDHSYFLPLSVLRNHKET
jgi:hypothetical protein